MGIYLDNFVFDTDSEMLKFVQWFCFASSSV